MQHHQRSQVILGQVLDPIQHGVETRLQAGIFPPLGAVKGRAADGKCKPVVDVHLH
jgi:hypothetical protein